MRGGIAEKRVCRLCISEELCVVSREDNNPICPRCVSQLTSLFARRKIIMITLEAKIWLGGEMAHSKQNLVGIKGNFAGILKTHDSLKSVQAVVRVFAFDHSCRKRTRKDIQIPDQRRKERKF